MKRRQLGNSELHVTPIGLGTWPIGGGGWRGGWGPQDDEISSATIHRCLDLGINWIDTAPYYGLGHAEEVVGKAVAGKRDQVIIATKCGLVWDEGRTNVHEVLKRRSILQEAENSLKRLGTDFIDIYQIHWPKPDEDLEEAVETISDLIKQGKVRYVGASNFSVGQMERARAIQEVVSLQLRYGMMEREAERELLPYCHRTNVGVISYWSMQGGLLSGKFTKQRVENLPDDDWRKTRHFFLEPELSINLKLVEGLRSISRNFGCSVAQVVIAWGLRRPELTGAILGSRKPSQIEETVKAADIVLEKKVLKDIEALLEKRNKELSKVKAGDEA